MEKKELKPQMSNENETVRLPVLDTIVFALLLDRVGAPRLVWIFYWVFFGIWWLLHLIYFLGTMLSRRKRFTVRADGRIEIN